MEFVLELFVELVIEGIQELVKRLKVHRGLKIFVGMTLIIAFIMTFIWSMNKLGVW